MINGYIRWAKRVLIFILHDNFSYMTFAPCFYTSTYWNTDKRRFTHILNINNEVSTFLFLSDQFMIANRTPNCFIFMFVIISILFFSMTTFATVSEKVSKLFDIIFALFKITFLDGNLSLNIFFYVLRTSIWGLWGKKDNELGRSFEIYVFLCLLGNQYLLVQIPDASWVQYYIIEKQKLIYINFFGNW